MLYNALSITVPADNHCSELPPVANGGIVYDNLNLSPGAVGKYICDVAYILQPLYGHYQFTCTEDGIWDGNVTEVPVECVCECAYLIEYYYLIVTF